MGHDGEPHEERGEVRGGGGQHGEGRDGGEEGDEVGVGRGDREDVSSQRERMGCDKGPS